MKYWSHVVLAACGALAAAALPQGPALAQADNACLGSLMLFGGSFCPVGYAEANGAQLSIQQNTALFSLYGTMYGGNGVTTFGLPDLRGRAPVGQGQGPGLPNYTQGQATGSPTSTILVQNMPAHSHPVSAVQGNSSGGNPSGQLLAEPPSSSRITLYSGATPNATMSPAMIGQTGGNQPLTTQSPIEAIRWCVAVRGIYCPRQ